jgi:nucleoside-diphosphate-sugar epimerase
MTVLITGVTGFTGGHLARHLLACGHHVRGLVRPSSAERAKPLAAQGLEVAEGDLTAAAMLGPACRGVDVVYHIAATYREAGQRDASYLDINVGGTTNLLRAALENGVRRFVHCSTGGVHGHIEHPPATEDAPLAPGDVYQRSKLEGELAAAEFGRQHPIEVVVVRPIGIYGPGDLRFLKMFRGLARGRFPMLGSGTVFYHLTYIDDLAEGFRLCGETGAAAGRTFLLAGPEYTTLADLVHRVAAAVGGRPPRVHWPVWPFWLAGALCEAVSVPLGVEPPLYRRRVDFYRKSRAFDTTRARTVLGYNPQVSLQEGLRRTAEWYRTQGLL